MNLGLEGRVAVVTGAASGIGAACAEAFAAEGCRLVVSDIAQDHLDELAAANPDTFSAVVADLGTETGPATIIDHAVAQFGRLDVLVSAGGIFGTARGGLFAGPEGASTIDVEDWDRTLRINL